MKKMLMMLLGVAFATCAWADSGDIYSIRPLGPNGSGMVYKAGESVYFQVRLLARNYNEERPTPFSIEHIGSDYGEDFDSNPPMLGIVVSGQLRGAKIVGVLPADIVKGEDRHLAPYTDLICEYVVQPGDIASPIKLALNGSTENDPIIPEGEYDVRESGYILLNGDKWQIVDLREGSRARLWFTERSNVGPALEHWGPEVIGPSEFDYDLAEANFHVNAPLDPIEYLTWDEATKAMVATNTTSYTVVTADTATFEDKKWYVVKDTIERGEIKVDGAAHLILCDGASLKVTGGYKKAGIEVPTGKSLTIYGQSEGEGAGKLVANGGYRGASIGGNYEGSCGTITINGGMINAIGGNFAAGIGGGELCSTAATITINGGEIEAIGGQYCAGIGAGNYYEFNGSRSGTDMITINGGTITATGGEFGAGIGCGYKGFAAKVTINGGEIMATAGRAGEGIGSGYQAKTATTVTFGEGVEFPIVAGADEESAIATTVADYVANHSATYVKIAPLEPQDPIEYLTWDEEAKSLVAATNTSYTVVTKDTATLGNGWYVVPEDSFIVRGAITVTGAAHLILCDGACLVATGGDSQAGIEVAEGKSLTIYESYPQEGVGVLSATGGEGGAGIGGKKNGTCGTITINGGLISATGGDEGAGIGGGSSNKNAAAITINGGGIMAIGGEQGAGIGSGDYYYYGGRRSGTDVITINGGTIQATGGEYAAGIGGGCSGFAATVTINGGTITASTTPDAGAEAIGSGYGPVSLTTVTFGEDAGYRIVTGDDPATAEIVLAADFATDHCATSVSCTPYDPVNVSFPAVAGLKYTVVVDGDEYFGAVKDGVETFQVPNGSTVTITYSPDNSTITLGTGITNPVTLTNITEAKAFTKADLPSVTQTTPISYLAWDDEKKKLYTELSTNFIYEVVTEKTKNLNDGFWYVVNTDVERGRIKVNGSAHLILCDGASLKVTGCQYAAGVEVAEGRSLTIYGQSEGTGKLEAKGGWDGAGIGGARESTTGAITINGGTIAAISSGYGAGIGGGSWNANAVTITINGGEIEANGGVQGAGIGAGNYYNYGESRSGTDVITINGGTITATGGQWGAGIGSGSDGLAATVTINGGTITASTVPGQGAEAIGNGADAVAATTVAFAEGVEFSIDAGADEASATETTVADYVANHSAVYVKIESGSLPKVTVDEIIDGENWTTFDVSYTLENLEEGVDYKVIIDVTAGGVTKTITNATDIVIGSFTNSVDTVKLFGSKVFDEKAKVKVSLEADGEIVASSTEETVELLPPPVEYLDWNGTEFVAATNQAYEVVTAETATFEDKKWYVVTNTIERAGIKVNGAAHLILCDGAKLKVTGAANKAGIEVPADKSLTIYGQSEGTGKLEASSAMLGAGIGGSSQGSCGAITINGGTIKATGGAGGAGIGGGMAGTSAATITINGGEIEAIGGRSSAGIGSGAYNGFSVSRIDTDLITINGGTIKATGGSWAAGIGSGESGFAATVVINGGEITASTEYADAIGSGFNAKEVATVIFGTAMASKHVWAGASASNGVTMTTAAFATMHRMTYVELPVETYEVAYDKNGATGTMSNSVFAVSKEVSLKKNAFTAVGYDFAGWTTNGTDVVYADEEKGTDFATTNATLTLTAKWNATGVSIDAFDVLTNTLVAVTNQAASLPVTITLTGEIAVPQDGVITVNASPAITFVGEGMLDVSAIVPTFGTPSVVGEGFASTNAPALFDTKGVSKLVHEEGTISLIARGESEDFPWILDASTNVTAWVESSDLVINNGLLANSYDIDLVALTNNVTVYGYTPATPLNAKVKVGEGDYKTPTCWIGESDSYETLGAALEAGETTVLPGYEVVYEANGAAGSMTNSYFAAAKDSTLKANEFSAVGYDFAGWTSGTNTTVIADSATVKDLAPVDGSATLTAQWSLNADGVTATSFTNLTNLIAKAGQQASTLPITIDFTSDVKIEGAALPTLPTGKGFSGIKYVGDDEGGSNLYIEDGVLYGDVLRGEVTVDALQLMQLAMGGSISSFQAISEGETTVTNAVVMLLGDNGKAYFNDTDDVDQMIADILAADPRPTTVKLYEVKGAIVTFEAMGGLIEAGVDPLGNAYEGGVENTTYLCLPDTGYQLPDVTRADYKLIGWYDGWTNGVHEVTNKQEIVNYSEHSLYAKWQSTKIHPSETPGEKIITTKTGEDGTIARQSDTSKLPAELILPETDTGAADGTPLTKIDAQAFAGLKTITKVALPIYVSEIGSRAFYNEKNLGEITFVQPLDYTTLEKVPLTIGDYAFFGSKIEKVTIPSTTSKLGTAAFANCANLREVTILGKLTIEGDYPFRNCGTKDDPVMITLSPRAAADQAFIDSLTNGCINVVINSQYAGEITATAIRVDQPEVGKLEIDFTYSANDVDLNVDTVTAVYAANFTGVSANTPLIPLEVRANGENKYTAVFSKPTGSSGFFRLTVNIEK